MTTIVDDGLKEVFPDDWESISALARLEKEAFTNEAISPQQLALLARSGKLFLLADQSEFVGEAIVLPTMKPNSYLLISLAITTSRQGRGFGKVLLKKVLDRMTAIGAESLELTVDPENTAAFTLYTKFFGFTKVAFIQECFGPGHDRWLLRFTFPNSVNPR